MDISRTGAGILHFMFYFRGARDRKGKSHWIFDDLDKSASLLGCFVSPAAEILKEEWKDVDDAWVLMIDRSTSEHSFAIDHVGKKQSIRPEKFVSADFCVL